MRELGDVLEDAVTSTERSLDGLTPAPGRLAEVRGRVRRRRAVRRTVQALAAAPLVAAVGMLGVTLVDRPAPPPPAETSSPEPTPAPTEPTPEPSEPAPEPTEEPPAPEPEPLGEAIRDNGFPPYHPAPEGVLEQAGPGWVLAIWQTVDESPGMEDGLLGAGFPHEVVFLVDPQGVRYWLLELPLTERPDGDTVTRRTNVLVDWTPGDGTAVVQERFATWRDGGHLSAEIGPLVTLDLRTGERLPGAGDPAMPWPDGAELLDRVDEMRLWFDGAASELVLTEGRARRSIPVGMEASSASISPDGRHALVDMHSRGDVGAGESVDGTFVVDLEQLVVLGEAGDGSGEEDECAWHHAVGWWSEGTMLVVCSVRPWGDEAMNSYEQGTRLVLVDVGAPAGQPGEVLRVLGPDDVVPGRVEHVRDGVVVTGGTRAADDDAHTCPAAPYLVDRAGATALTLTDTFRGSLLFEGEAVGSRLLVRVVGCQDPVDASQLLAYDSSGAGPVELFGPPVGDDPWIRGVTSYVVAR